MKRNELKVGQVVETKSGNIYRVVSLAGWRNWGGHRLDATGVEYSGIPVLSTASRVPATGRVGVLVVGEQWLQRIRSGDKAAGTTLQGEPWMPQHLYPAGTYDANIKARRAAFEAQVDADTKRDQELLEDVRRYWGEETAEHLLESCGVILDDGLLTDREVATLRTIVICGINR